MRQKDIYCYLEARFFVSFFSAVAHYGRIANINIFCPLILFAHVFFNP